MTKICCKCHEEKPLNAEFWHRTKWTKDGFQVWCKICKGEYTKKYLESSIYHNNKARYRENGRLSRNASTRLWKKNNREAVQALCAKRNATKMRALPSWANLNNIAIFYEIASLYSELYEPYHIDHIIPLQGKNVRGLHVENNLQILPAFENRQKGNKFYECKN